MKIKVKYHDKDLKKLKHIGGKDKSVMIDLYTSEEVTIEAGEYKLLDLGISMELPKGYQANIVPRSSTFKKYGILQANSYGVIDGTYCGDNDRWKMPIYKPVSKNSIKKLMGDFIKDVVEDKEGIYKISEYVENIELDKITIPKNTRLCQFEINKVMEDVEIEEVKSLNNKDRGGLGSTGK